MDSKIKILFFASIPDGTNQLNVDEEVRSISAKIRSAEHRDVFELIPLLAARPDDLLQGLNEHTPTIVHFSGHGLDTGELVFTDDSGRMKLVSMAALRTLFSTLKDNIRLVMLNACDTTNQATAIAKDIDCAIGMNGAITDGAAISFAASFYRALSFGKSVKNAFAQGQTSLMLEGFTEENVPKLMVHKGIDPGAIYLVSESITSAQKEVAGDIFNLSPKFKGLETNRKEEIATYYRNISNTLKEVASAIRKDEIPYSMCEKLFVYAKQLPDTIGDFIGPKKARMLSKKLGAAHMTKEGAASFLRQFKEIDGERKETILADLEKSSGFFEAAADNLMASAL